MSSKIRVLDEDTINKIAAGEVIENPASVVKELVENALDAKATEISIEIRGGGRQLIRISDNGCGMNADDALLCLERHATSKLKHIEGLHQALTMGFRGEAIPSIASISKFTLITRLNLQQEEPGTIVMVDGGKIMHYAPVECVKGTTIEVKSLFFNVPVRKKFQKSPAYDTAEIQRVVSLLALGYPEIHFKLISDQEILLSVPLSDKQTFSEILKDRILHLFGTEFLDSLIPLQSQTGEYELTGYISRPTCTRHNRTGQHLFINRRGVIVPLINFALREGYGTMLGNGRHPLYVMHLTMPADLLDVNVHPQKKEVRLRQERQLKELIISNTSKTLQAGNFNTGPPFCAPFLEMKESHLGSYRPNFTIDTFASLSPSVNEPSSFHSDLNKAPEQFTQIELDQIQLNKTEINFNTASSKSNISPSSFHDPILPPATQSNKTLFASFEEENSLHQFKVVTTLQKYLLAVDVSTFSKQLYIIDQKAAHARIIYEKLKHQEQEAIELQILLIPHILNLTASEAALLQEKLPLLQLAGIQIKEFGQHSFVVDALPQVFGNIDIRQLIDEITKINSETDTVLALEQKRWLSRAASRAAISSKTLLNLSEAQILLDQLTKYGCPSQCPYGKKIFVTFTTNDIAKLF